MGLVVIVVATVGVLAWIYPSVAAISCPRCYGLERLRDDLYAERDLPASQQQQIIDVYAVASERVTDFYGGRVSRPRVLACMTDGCYTRIGGGGERGIAVLNRAVLLSPRGIDPAIAAHEMSHVEFHRRLTASDHPVPQWFDEGLAVLVAQDSRYLPSPGVPCPAGGPLPATLPEWLRAATADDRIYADAACRVRAYGDNRAILHVIDRLNHGEAFTEVAAG